MLVATPSVVALPSTSQELVVVPFSLHLVLVDHERMLVLSVDHEH